MKKAKNKYKLKKMQQNILSVPFKNMIVMKVKGWRAIPHYKGLKRCESEAIGYWSPNPELDIELEKNRLLGQLARYE